MSKRIGQLFSLFSAIMLIYGITGFWSSTPSNRTGIMVAIGFFALCSAVFFYSSRSKYGNCIQIATVSVISIPTLYLGEQKVFGVMVLFVAFSLCVAYGFYNKRRKLRLAITAAAIYAVLVVCNKTIDLSAFPRAAVWLAFMVFLSMVMWTIFRDYTEREWTIETVHIKTLIRLNDELIALAKEQKSELDKVKG